jgi:hypothetical protein
MTIDDGIIVRAAKHMIQQHGRHAADFADYRSREMQALGHVEAAELWSAVARSVRERQTSGAALLCPV